MATPSYHNGDLTVRAHPSFPNLHGAGNVAVAGTLNVTGDATLGAVTVTSLSAGAVTSSGPAKVPFSAITTSTPLTTAHSHVAASTASGAVILTLPAAVTGTIYVVEKADDSTNLLTVAPTGVETIDGVNAAVPVMGKGSSITLIASAASAWIIISRTERPFIRSVTTTGTTLNAYDDIVTVNAAGATTTTLLSTVPAGKIYRVKNVGAGAATISAGAGTIDGAGTYSLAAQWDAAIFVHNGSNLWYALAIGP